MKKAVVKNLISHLLIGIGYVLYWYLKILSERQYVYGWRLAGIFIPCILIGAALYWMDLSSRACNAVFLAVNLVCIGLVFWVIFPVDILLHTSIMLSALFLLGVIFPKNKSGKEQV